MASSPAYFLMHFDDDNGVPLNGGLVGTFLTGTNTPAAVFLDKTGTIPATNPVVLNARGEAVVYLDDTKVYKFQVSTSTGVPIRTVDPVSGINADFAQAGVNSGANLIAYQRLAGTTIAKTLGQTENNSSINVCEFLTEAQVADARSGTNALDCTAGINTAIAYCIANNLDLEIPYLFKITTLNINRIVDGLAFDSYFTIYSTNGGGFYKDAEGSMFSSSQTYTGTPVTHLIKWKNIRFVGSTQALGAYVLDANKFLRVAFVDCSFSKMRFSTQTTGEYYQSFYLINCQARRWSGTFMAGVRAYDFQVIGGMYEGAGGQHGFNISNITGGKVWTQIEGVSGTALWANGAQGLDICSYFEANGLDFDCRTGGITNSGINLHGSQFRHDQNATFSVVWGACNGCVSHGNLHFSNMHDLQGDSNVDINDQAFGNLSNQGNVVFNSGYREAIIGLTLQTPAGGSYTTTAVIAKYTKHGKQIHVTFQATLTSTGTNPAAQIYLSAGLPFTAEANNALCGYVEVIGSTQNQGVSPLYLSTASPVRAISSLGVIPANTTGQSWPVRGFLTYTGV